MSKSPLGPIEALIIDHIRTTISANEAKEANVVLPWMVAFFAARFVTILTATPIDVAAFCDERAKTRTPRSMARLVTLVKLIFRTLFGVRLRDDNPSIDLKPPSYTRDFVDFGVDDALVRELLDKQQTIAARATGPSAFVQARRLAILHFSAAGAFCPEISSLEYLEVCLTLAAGELVRAGRATGDERDLRLDGRGLRAVDDYIRLRRSTTASPDGALFVSALPPFNRLSPRGVSDDICRAIKATGLAGRGLSPARLHRSLSGNALKGGHGGKVAAFAGGYRLMLASKPVNISREEMSDLIELHHPMNRLPYLS